jgi:hypothetical protein
MSSDGIMKKKQLLAKKILPTTKNPLGDCWKYSHLHKKCDQRRVIKELIQQTLRFILMAAIYLEFNFGWGGGKTRQV